MTVTIKIIRNRKNFCYAINFMGVCTYGGYSRDVEDVRRCVRSIRRCVIATVTDTTIGHQANGGAT